MRDAHGASVAHETTISLVELHNRRAIQWRMAHVIAEVAKGANHCDVRHTTHEEQSRRELGDGNIAHGRHKSVTICRNECAHAGRKKKTEASRSDLSSSEHKIEKTSSHSSHQQGRLSCARQKRAVYDAQGDPVTLETAISKDRTRRVEQSREKLKKGQSDGDGGGWHTTKVEDKQFRCELKVENGPRVLECM